MDEKREKDPCVPRPLFEGLKVADFSWAAVGPLTTKYLVDHGATVVRVESVTRPDAARVMEPFRDNIPGINRSGFYAIYNNNKYSLALNLNHPRAREITRRLLAWADVTLESFAPGVKERWGLTYEEIKKIKPDMIMLSTSNQGQTGPRAKHPGYGTQLLSLAGISYTTGWPDREPSTPYAAYTDYIAYHYSVASLMAALLYRRRTGKGQYIDLSQYEACVHFLSPTALDYVANKRNAQRQGNRCGYAAPHGAFPCRGQDRWCVIAIFTDQEWQTLCRVMGNPDLAREPRFATLLSRKQNETELEKIIAAWTFRFTPEEMLGMLQKAGVAAGVVETAQDLMENDPQLQSRGHFQRMNHPEMGDCAYERLPFRLSRNRDEMSRCAPCLGQDTEKVCCDMLGLADEEFIELLNEEVFR